MILPNVYEGGVVSSTSNLGYRVLVETALFQGSPWPRFSTDHSTHHGHPKNRCQLSHGCRSTRSILCFNDDVLATPGSYQRSHHFMGGFVSFVAYQLTQIENILKQSKWVEINECNLHQLTKYITHPQYHWCKPDKKWLKFIQKQGHLY